MARTGGRAGPNAGSHVWSTADAPTAAFVSKGLGRAAHIWFHEFFINILLFHNEGWLTQNCQLIKSGFALCLKIPSSSAVHLPPHETLANGKSGGRILTVPENQSEERPADAPFRVLSQAGTARPGLPDDRPWAASFGSSERTRVCTYSRE